MNKNLSRDAQLLAYILKNQRKIQQVIMDFRCDFSTSASGLHNNVYAFDLCALYMAQIGENIKLLTDDSKAELNSYVSINKLKYFRNMIDHDYEKVNKEHLTAYIKIVTSNVVIDATKKRWRYCIDNRKTGVRNNKV